MRILPILPMLLLLACAGTRAIEPQIVERPVDWSGAAEVRIALSSFEFTPRELTLMAGQPYRLEFVNEAGGGHDFTAPEFFAAARVDARDAAKIADGRIDLDGGESVTVRLIPAAGSYDIVCTHFGHAMLGMRGDIVVE
ncbi:MAG: cupredoxin domain-containing protein [Sphingomonadaceae bacterium]